jgi:phage regulator Rha-like protein
MNEKDVLMVPEEIIMSKIYFIRNQKVMLDFDLAELYGVQTKQLKRSVRRNFDRFPNDFMFELSPEELKIWRSQFGTSNYEKMGLRITPFAFTEHGVLMLVTVINSKNAIHVNILIVRIFTKMHKHLQTHAGFSENLRKYKKMILNRTVKSS